MIGNKAGPKGSFSFSLSFSLNFNFFVGGSVNVVLWAKALVCKDAYDVTHHSSFCFMKSHDFTDHNTQNGYSSFLYFIVDIGKVSSKMCFLKYFIVT